MTELADRPAGHYTELLREAYLRWEACRGTDPAVWTDLMADDFHLFSVGAGRHGAEFSAACRSRDEALIYLTSLSRGWEMLYQPIDDFIEQGNRVAAMGTATWANRRTGKLIETPKADIWTFRGGRAVEVREFFDSAALFAAASPGPPPPSETEPPVAC
ncbi:hypothetical protein LNKW23_30970 [Paralimibaculum aggregatum]|uniref:SnoaL-like domain-containing protein n=1 Tax=Paralimibaculum aggregatum TaxID=3036245 RepID=A0ABQ6LKW6_9RHOB|nr:nuclear transport factor 2 family protein [Limibaculum sp. NKW23]GMG83883.1 hypothetical protein LNKW23_30970 [Limibaculum sp. NKW23]